MSRFFRYDDDRRFALLVRPFGLRTDRDGVTLTDDGRFVATFGRFRIDTVLDNVVAAHVTGPYRWWRSVGVRLSLRDDGLTFGTSTGPGACVEFRDRVRRAIGFRDHSALTVTVADPEGLVAALTRDTGP